MAFFPFAGWKKAGGKIAGAPAGLGVEPVVSRGRSHHSLRQRTNSGHGAIYLIGRIINMG